MAVKAVARIYEYDFDGTDITFYCDIAVQGVRHYNVACPPMAANTSGSAANAALKDFCKEYAEETLEVEFGLFDTVKLFQGVDLI